MIVGDNLRGDPAQPNARAMIAVVEAIPGISESEAKLVIKQLVADPDEDAEYIKQQGLGEVYASPEGSSDDVLVYEDVFVVSLAFNEAPEHPDACAQGVLCHARCDAGLEINLVVIDLNADHGRSSGRLREDP